ncbi:MAG: UTP--glucose-1-phosphate uridylyltransferase GalU [Gammaproteobacteria bacterium]|nr:UTP--glucose-1-phosphate uridylyltransferase GalU [Gammaproteobacteria bacterium]
MSSVKTAVFPVAGLGTRFLPATKSVAKEMLSIVDKPLIQYGAEEAIEAGINKLVFIVGRTKNSIIDHFDKSYELETELDIRGKAGLLKIVRDVIPDGVHCLFIRQSEALGLGHAVLCAEPAVGQEPFAVILPDDLIRNEGNGCVKQMVKVFDQYQSSIIGTQTVAIEESDKYGMVAGEQIEDRIARVDEIVEKPSPSQAPSDQAIVGRYVLTPAIFDILKTTRRGAGDEIQLTDGIASLREQEQVLSYSFEGRRYDCGSKLGYLQATVDFALRHDELADDFKHYLKQLDL